MADKPKYGIYCVRLGKVAEPFHFLGTDLSDVAAQLERWLREPVNAGRFVEGIDYVGPLTSASPGALNPAVPGCALAVEG